MVRKLTRDPLARTVDVVAPQRRARVARSLTSGSDPSIERIRDSAPSLDQPRERRRSRVFGSVAPETRDVAARAEADFERLFGAD
jgi:hypothetical protein